MPQNSGTPDADARPARSSQLRHIRAASSRTECGIGFPEPCPWLGALVSVVVIERPFVGGVGHILMHLSPVWQQLGPSPH
jgi:hypothetical protein